MEKEDFKNIKETVSRNEETTKQVLKQVLKFKKFNYLKHIPDPDRNKQLPQITAIQDSLKPVHARISKDNWNIASNSINQNTNWTGEKPTLNQKLQFSPPNIQEADPNHQQGKHQK